MQPRNFVSETNLAEHFGDCGYHLVDENENIEDEEMMAQSEESEDEGLLICEAREPFEPESHWLKNESPVGDYLERVQERVVGRQPKVAISDYY